MLTRIFLALGLLALLAFAFLYYVGLGLDVEPGTAGVPAAPAVDPSLTAERSAKLAEAAKQVGVARPKQILFGDLHVHSTFSFDAFQMSLPMSGGDGAHPVSDACDFARHCAALDFWSINDHGVTLTPRRWNETVDAIRQCNEIAGDWSNPDLVSYLGWEWTQVGTTPENHYGHKNVVLRDLEDDQIPTRPITAGTPPGLPSIDETTPSPPLLGLLALTQRDGGAEFARYMNETGSVRDCPVNVPVRELPDDCREVAPTPKDLFAKLDDWGHAAMVIPHGTTWGMYTPLGSAWDKQLTPEMHDPDRQGIVEVFSGHGNSEEFRPFREVVSNDDGTRSCPEPNEGYLPSCWRAGEIIEERCLEAGFEPDECASRAETARQNFVDAGFNGGAATVPGWTVPDWQDAGQCRDCFQPSFNYRPKSSVQYMMALGRPGPDDEPQRFRFGFIAASDNHSARPGTGYKEFARTEFTEARFGNFVSGPLVAGRDRPALPESEAVDFRTVRAPFSLFETERQASFFLNGGLAAVHADGRDREAIWDALQRREVYGTSGPRILLWFDLLNPPTGRTAPMGSEHTLSEAPIFQVRAVGSLVQQRGCPDSASEALGPERLARLCRGECYHPSDSRRLITRIEVVRIRPQEDAGEEIDALIEDPWKVLTCPRDQGGCQVAFTDDEYRSAGRDALYYVRAIQQTSLAVAADPLGCTIDETGRCIEVDPCFDRPEEDECLAETEERAWSSPIFVNQPRS
ncbi:MAG: DUF3604 domain-containing protein [Myxococcota bacterium]|nr:DUF3604 domain-containing protein [Myxococcota bacterium]